jgi:hypothetical protein
MAHVSVEAEKSRNQEEEYSKEKKIDVYIILKVK